MMTCCTWKKSLGTKLHFNCRFVIFGLFYLEIICKLVRKYAFDIDYRKVIITLLKPI